MNGNKTNEMEIRREVAKKIWEIARISPEHGNAVMDILGVNKYYYIADLANGRDPKDPNR